MQGKNRKLQKAEETAQWKMRMISKISSISSIPTVPCGRVVWKHHTFSLNFIMVGRRLHVILTDFVKSFLLKDSMGENITVFEGVPAWWIVNGDTWQTVLLRCSRYTIIPCPRAFSEGGEAAAPREQFLWWAWTRKCEHQPTEILFLWL